MQTGASVQLAIEEALAGLPAVYSVEQYHEKCAGVFLHVYETYYGQGRSRYDGAA